MAGLLLISGGVALGTVGSTLTSSELKYRAASRYATTGRIVEIAGIDQMSAGKAWAQSAFPGGLRRCPQMNEGFLAACEAEIKALSERPAPIYGNYGGPLMVTTIEPSPEASPTKFEREAAIEESRESQPAAYEEPPAEALVATEKTDENYPAIPYRQ